MCECATLIKIEVSYSKPIYLANKSESIIKNGVYSIINLCVQP